MATLTGGQWAEMETPNIEDIPLASQSILSKAQHLTRSIPAPFHPLYASGSDSEEASEDEQNEDFSQQSLFCMDDYLIHNPSLLQLAPQKETPQQKQTWKSSAASYQHTDKRIPAPGVHESDSSKSRTEQTPPVISVFSVKRKADHTIDQSGQLVDDDDPGNIQKQIQ